MPPATARRRFAKPLDARLHSGRGGNGGPAPALVFRRREPCRVWLYAVAGRRPVGRNPRSTRGLPPKDVRRQIECGLAAAGSAPTQQAAPESTQDASDGSTVKEPPEAATSDSGGLGAIVPASDTARCRPPICKPPWRLWGSTPAPKADQAEGRRPQSPTRSTGEARRPCCRRCRRHWRRCRPGPSARGRSTSLAAAARRSMPNCRSAKAGPAGTAASAGDSSAGAGGMTREGRRHEPEGELPKPPPTCFDGWKDDVLTGSPPTFYPIGSGELARIEIGPGLVTLFGGAPGAGKTAFTMQAAVDALRLTPTLRALVCNVEMPAGCSWTGS